MKKIIYIPIETKARELYEKLFLSHFLIKNGYSVIIGNKKNVINHALKIKSGILLGKSNGYYQLVKPKLNEKDEMFFVSLDVEGLVFSNEKLFLKRANIKNINELDICFLWGDKQKSLLEKNPHLNRKNILVSGNPRIDILLKKYNYLFANTVTKIQKQFGEFILINTSFSIANPDLGYGFSNLFEKYLKNVQIASEIELEELKEIKKHFLFEAEVINYYVDLIKDISNKFPDKNIVIRPHPSENVFLWKSYFKQLKNVFVVYKYSSIEWILASKVVIHTICTTGIESELLGRYVIRYSPVLRLSEEPKNIASNSGVLSKNNQETIHLLNSFFSNSPKSSSKNAHLSEYIRMDSEELASERIVKALDELLMRENIKLESYHYHKTLKVKLLSIVLKLNHAVRNIFKNLIGSSLIYNLLPRKIKMKLGVLKKNKKISKLEIQEFLILLDDDRKQNINIEMIKPNTYFLKGLK